MTSLSARYHAQCEALNAISPPSAQQHPPLLLAVSKTQPAEAVLSVYQAGCRHFGENYVQEGVAKIEKLDELLPQNQAIWHFIGPIQSNKTRQIAAYFDWVHTIDRFKIAERLSTQRPSSKGDLNLCVQVNISQEETKSGCTPEAALDLVLAITQLPHIRIRGLMAIPAATSDQSTQHQPFIAMRELFEHIKSKLPPTAALDFDTLSMGMSNDYPIAIQHGATIVRIGTAIFGTRLPTRQKELL